MKRRFILLIIMGIYFIFLISCQRDNDEESTLSVWNVYWDNETIEKEIATLQDSINEISYFAAYFASDNTIFVPKEVTNNFNRIKKEFKDNEYVHYLSIVNDKINLDGTSSLKDTQLLYQLFGDEKLDNHMDHIVSLAIEGGYDGIEMDYEGMKEDEELWRLLANYYTRLYEKLEKENLRMRILLEPSLPSYELDFPLGPDYIMMCYNLYGLGTEPGPKADPAFILELVEKMRDIPGSKSFAFATGGFDWEDEGRATAVTEQQAKDMMSIYKATPTRDESSQCIIFDYTDEKGIKHHVWFADSTTLNYWIEVTRSRGYNDYSIWRLNGNNLDSLKELKK